MVVGQACASARPAPVSTTSSTTPSASACRRHARLAAERHAPHRLRAEAAHRALRAGPAGHHAEPGLSGKPSLTWRLGDADIGGGGQFQPAAQRMAVTARRSSAGAAAPAGRRRGGRSAPSDAEIGGAQRRPGLDVAAGAEALALAGEEHDAHGIVAPRPRRPAAASAVSIAMSSALNFSGRAQRDVPTAPSCSNVTAQSAQPCDASSERGPIGASRKQRGVHDLQVVGDLRAGSPPAPARRARGRRPARSR